MPVLVVGVAIWEGAELVAGGLTVLQTIAAVGAVTAGVGVVTGNKTLTQIGAVMGIAGGVGALADSAGMLGDFGSTSAVNPETGDLSSLGGAPTPAPTPAPAPGAANVGWLDSTPRPVNPDTGNLSSLSASAPTPPAIPMTAPAAAAPQPGLANPETGDLSAINTGSKIPAGSTDNLDPSKGWMSSFTAFANQSPAHAMAAFGMMQAGGSLVQGMFNPLTGSQKAALDAQAASNQSQADLARQRAANIAQPMPAASLGSPVAVTGLLNNAGTVTGRV